MTPFAARWLVRRPVQWSRWTTALHQVRGEVQGEFCEACKALKYT